MTKITFVRALQDNYIWMFGSEPRQKIWIVDPGEAVPVIEKLREEKLILAGILLTHHHYDHSGGIAELLQYAGDIPVYGSSKSQITSVNRKLADGEDFYCGDLHFQALAIPGHTHDHMAYYSAPVLFSGDTLFSGACGKIFEGTAAEMFASLNKLMQLPDTTAVYCGHEYTLKNLRFVRAVEPDNAFLAQKSQQAELMLKNHGCSLPSLLRDEKQFNPFLRCDQPQIKTAVSKYCGKSLESPVQVFAELRAWKNNF